MPINHLLLDHHGDALPPGGSVVIEREIDLLDALLDCLDTPANGEGSTLLVRGQPLCSWAEKAWRGRGWPCRDWHSPYEAMQTATPMLSRANCALIWDELGPERDSLQQPYFAVDLLQVLYPDFAWHSQPSVEHAAQWLLWMNAMEVPAHHAPLFQSQVSLWSVNATGAGALYAPSPPVARTLLRSWLHLENGEKAWGVFPLTVPSQWVQEILNFYKTRLTREGASVWEEWRRLPLPLAILEATANETGRFLTHHRAQALPAIVNSLLPFVSPAEAVRLRALSPPADPGALPENPEDVLKWATTHYLAFRLWQAESGDEESRARVEYLARAFGRWYLDWYAKAMVGKWARHLASHCAEELRLSDESAVVFWVIADGLGWADAQNLMHFLTNRNTRLTVAREEPVFAPIPTITHFCKTAVRWSATPAAVTNGTILPAARRETQVSGHRDAAGVLTSSEPGDMVIWMPLEPDKTYHEIADRSVAHTNVDGALRALGENILSAVSAVPQNRTLRIVISTDHGRLLGSSQRRHTVLPGYESHGRAAYKSGDSPLVSHEYDDSGVFIDGDLAWLEPERFALPVACVVPLDDGAFLKNSRGGQGQGGIEEFPHGGVFPEEVVIPWIEIERDARVLVVSAHITGRARPGLPGTMQITIENTNALHLVVEELSMMASGIEREWKRDDEIAPYSSLNIDIEVGSWPSRIALNGAVVRLTISRPDGRQFSITPSLALETEELQSRDENILGDMN